MSWQTYVDEHLMCDIEGQAGLKLSASAILGHDGAVWAQSATFPQVHYPSLSDIHLSHTKMLDYLKSWKENGEYLIQFCNFFLLIFGYVWCSWGLQLKPDEIKGILTDFEEPGHLAPTGLFFGGAKYMVIQGEPGAVIRGKKVSYFSIFFLYIWSNFSSCLCLHIDLWFG